MGPPARWRRHCARARHATRIRQVAEPPTWEACALGGETGGELISAQLYRDAHVALVLTDGAGGSTLGLLRHDDLRFEPMPSMPPCGALLGHVVGLVRSGALPCHPLAPERSRAFAELEASSLSLSQPRGMASMAVAGRRVVLLDLEEDEQVEEEEEAMDESD